MQRAAVLLVEDEPLIQGLLQTVLDEAGYDVLVADDGAEALALLDGRAAQIEGLVTDINLGSGPNGWDVAERARELTSELPVVYITGDNEHLWSRRGVGRSVLLAKPFNPEQVVRALTALFDEPSDNG